MAIEAHRLVLAVMILTAGACSRDTSPPAPVPEVSQPLKQPAVQARQPTRWERQPELSTVAVITQAGVAVAAPTPDAEPVLRLSSGDRFLAGERSGSWLKLDSAPVEAWAPASSVMLAEMEFEAPETRVVVNDDEPLPEADPNLWTADRIRALSGDGVSVAGSIDAGISTRSSTGASGVATSTAPAATASAGDESSWRSQAQAALGEISSLESEIAGYNSQEAQLKTLKERIMLGLAEGSPTAIQGQVTQIQSQRLGAEQRLSRAQASYSSLKERGRKAGVPPGWLR